MEPEWILRLVLIGMAHWILAGIMIQDLANRQKVFGGRKSTWAIIILLLIPCFGSFLYLLFHPQIINPDNSQRGHRQDERDRRGK